MDSMDAEVGSLVEDAVGCHLGRALEIVCCCDGEDGEGDEGWDRIQIRIRGSVSSYCDCITR